MTFSEKIALAAGVYLAAMAGVTLKCRLPKLYFEARRETGNPYYD